MTFVVTATSGHLGRLVVESLLERGIAADQILATARDTAKIADLGVPTAVIDYAAPETVTAAVKPGDTFLLVSASVPGTRVALHVAAIDAAIAAGVARIVYTSAPAATTSALVLAPEHKATEEYLVAAGVPFTILRNGWYTENYAGVVETAKATGEIVASVADGRVASASRKDYADAAAVALTDDSLAGQTVELSGDYAWSHDELAAAVGEIVGREVTYKPVSPEEHAELLTSFGLDEGTVGFVVALDGNTRDGLLGVVTGDLSRIIGRPTTPLAAGLAA
jgi:NAD(P)H dehydrogenase (quinone)